MRCADDCAAAVNTSAATLAMRDSGVRSLAASTDTAAAQGSGKAQPRTPRSEEHTSELQSPCNLVCRLLLEKTKKQAAKNVFMVAGAAGWEGGRWLVVAFDEQDEATIPKGGMRQRHGSEDEGAEAGRV